MTVFEFARSRGCEPLINGLWARGNGHPASNCLPIDQMLLILLKEDCAQEAV